MLKVHEHSPQTSAKIKGDSVDYDAKLDEATQYYQKLVGEIGSENAEKIFEEIVKKA